MKERILIIEDDEAIQKVSRRALVYEGNQVDAARMANPGCSWLRKTVRIWSSWIGCFPAWTGWKSATDCGSAEYSILMLTAKDTTEDRVHGLDAGAMICGQTLELEELLARVRALLRRTQSDRAPVLNFADLVLDTSTRQAIRKQRAITLTAKEYDLLELFMRHPRQVLTRELIFDRVWGYDFGGESNVLDVYIRYLRQKLENEGEDRLIHTVRSVGYVLRETP